MYYCLDDSLSFTALARAWAAEPGSKTEHEIEQRLLSAYWLGEFECLHVSGRHDHWPFRQDTLQALELCGGLPIESHTVLAVDDWSLENLAAVPKEAYPPPGRAILDAVDLPRDMIKAWCLDKSIAKPAFLFDSDEDETKRFPGRPSMMHRIEDQMELRAQQGRLASMISRESEELAEWAKTNRHPEDSPPKAKTIANVLRSQYSKLKATT